MFHTPPDPGNHHFTLCFYLFNFLSSTHLWSKSFVKSQSWKHYRKLPIQTPVLMQDEHLNQPRRDSLPYLKAVKSFPCLLLRQPALKSNSRFQSAMKRIVHPDHFMSPWSVAEMSKAEGNREKSKDNVCNCQHFIYPSKLKKKKKRLQNSFGDFLIN